MRTTSARPGPRAALLFGACGAGAALTGPLAAAGVLLLALALAAAARLGPRRFVPLAGSFALVAVVVPFAPGPATRAVVQGLAVSSAVLVAVSLARWDRLVAAFQALGAGRGTVAFLAIAFSRVEATGRDAARALEALRLRGGFRGPRGLARSASLLLARELRRALARADGAAEALALRGFDGRLPSLPRGGTAPGDRAALAAALLSVAIAVGSLLPWSR